MSSSLAADIDPASFQADAADDRSSVSSVSPETCGADDDRGADARHDHRGAERSTGKSVINAR
jgi:hypothetical protein